MFVRPLWPGDWLTKIMNSNRNGATRQLRALPPVMAILRIALPTLRRKLVFTIIT